MKYRSIYLFTCLLLLFSCGRRDPYRHILLQIDAEMGRYEQRKSAMNDSLKKQYTELEKAWTDSMKWEMSYAIFDSYALRNTDSVSVYLQRMSDVSWESEFVFRTKVCLAKSYALINHSRLEQLMPEILNHHVSEDFYPRYLSLMIDVYFRSPELSSYSSHYIDFLEMAIENASYPQDRLMWYCGLRALAYNKVNDAVQYLNAAFDSSDDISLKGACAESLADIYATMGNRNLEKSWLAKSSLYHLIGLEGELSSLYKLSLILSEEGDHTRAANYIRTVIERASSSGFPELVIGSATGSLAVTDAINRIDKTRQSILFTALGGAILLLLVLLLIFVRDKRRNRLLLKTKESLSISNEQLSDVNKIKDGYLIKYMNLSISYLGMIDEDRRMLRRMMKNEGVESLMAELRKTSTTLNEYKDFYRTFDNIFLGLYPDFVTRVNEYFQPQDRFRENGKLTTPLRILALIRLGYTESGEIARFLNCSPETIYSHRSKLKSKAVCEKLEDMIKCIG